MLRLEGTLQVHLVHSPCVRGQTSKALSKESSSSLTACPFEDEAVGSSIPRLAQRAAIKFPEPRGLGKALMMQRLDPCCGEIMSKGYAAHPSQA